jgi:hypothetical protein
MDDTSRQHNSAAPRDGPASLEVRLRSLEESLAFAQRESDEALSQLIAMDARIRELVKRLAKVEAALARQAEQDAAGEPDAPEPEAPGLEP